MAVVEHLQAPTRNFQPESPGRITDRQHGRSSLNQEKTHDDDVAALPQANSVDAGVVVRQIRRLRLAPCPATVGRPGRVDVGLAPIAEEHNHLFPFQADHGWLDEVEGIPDYEFSDGLQRLGGQKHHCGVLCGAASGDMIPVEHEILVVSVIGDG